MCIRDSDKIKQLEISSQERERELNLKDLIADTEIDRKKLEAYFIGAGNAKTVEFTKHLEGLALATGVTEKKTLNYEAISGLPSSGVVSAIRYKVDASGKWQNIYYFLQEIENLPTVMLLNGVSLSFNTPQTASPETKAVSSRWSASLDFSVAQLKN